MKKTFACMAGAIALMSGFGVWTSWSVAQAPAQPAPQRGTAPVVQQTANTTPATTPATQPQSGMSGTRVAVVNINKVLKDYQKAQFLNNSIKNEVQQYSQKMEDKKKQMANLQAQLQQPGSTQAQRDQIEKNVLNIQRELQDLDNEARKVIGKRQGDIAVQIFREIETVIQAVATRNHFELVLSYPDATDTAEQYSQDNIVRKLAAQAAMPIYYMPHIDMTKAVVDTLNISFPPPAAPTPPAPGAPAPKK